MPFIVTSRKFFKEIVNGSNFGLNPLVFDTFLKGNALEKFRADYELELSWQSLAQAGIEFTINGNTITRPNGSFLDDGFIDGDAVEIVSSAGTNARNITSVSDTILIFDGATLPTETSATIEIHGITDLTGVEFTYNLLENAASFQEPNLQDGSVMQFRVDGLGFTFKEATFSANPITGQNGKFDVRKISSSDPRVNKFAFQHEFINYPFFLDDERAAFEGGANINVLKDGRSLKYAFKFKAGKTSQNPNERKFINEIDTLGNTGGFDENFNGNQPSVFVDSISYTDTLGNPVSGLNALEDTNVSISLKRTDTSTDLDFNHKIVACFSKLPAPNDIDQNKTFEENFVIDTLLTERNAAPVSSTAIEDLTVTAGAVASEELVIDFVVRFNASQQALLSEGDSYLISVSFDDLNNLNTVTTNARADVNTITKSADIPGLFQVEAFGYYRQDAEINVDTPFTDFKGWNGDMVLKEVDFSLTRSLSAKIQDLTFRLVAFDTVSEQFFEIYNNSFFLQNTPINGDQQQINISQDLNYNLPIGDFFRRATLINNGQDATKNFYRLRIPFRLSYADYLALPDADGSFFDASQPNNGLNEKLSNYSGVNRWEIRTFIDANVTNDEFISTTTYRERFPFIEVYDYEEDAASQYSGATIELQTVGGLPFPDQEINRNQDTKVKATCTFSTPVDPALTEFNGVLRLEEFENGNNSKIQETTSIIIPLNSNIIQTTTGNDKLTVNNTGTVVEFEGLIKEAVAKNLPETRYAISIRPMNIDLIPATAKVTEAGDVKETEGGDIKEIE